MRAELAAEPNPAVLALAEQLRTSPSRPVAIGVLPIDPLDGGAEAQRLAAALTEELTSAAAHLPGVRVAARTLLLAMRHETADLRELGPRLGLAAVVEGSVRRDGDRIRLVVRLVDVADGCQMWASRFERELREGEEALAREVMERIGQALRVGRVPHRPRPAR